MTAQEITDIATPFMSNIVPSEGANLLRGEYRLNDKVAGIYFIEFSDNAIDFDIDQFQEDHISSDYYNHPGYLQWNNYLIFIRDNDTVPLLVKNTIEKNDTYTRKFVFTLEEFKEYFSYSFSSHGVDIDVVSTWKEKLRAVDLDEVYSGSTYVSAIPRFLSGDVQKDESIDQNLPVAEQPTLSIDRISNITLRPSYREYPKPKRSFDLKTANLIHGVNGSGKTSLLTAIELVIAGKTIADPSNSESGGSIVAKYNDDAEFSDEYTPNNNSKYRLRDSAWYSSSYATGNELYRTFNRYNYFDSDAAYKLAFDEDNRNITKYLSAIALGPEFGRIQDRMIGFEERLSKELRIKEKSIEEQETRITDSKKIIDAIQEVSDPQARFELFTATAREIGWKAAIPESLISDTTVFESVSQSVQALISELERLTALNQVSTKGEVQIQISSVSASLAKIREAKRLINGAIQNSSEIKVKLEAAEREAALISRAKVFFDNPDSFDYPDIENKIGSLSTQVSRFLNLPERYAEISGWDILRSSDTIENTKNLFEENLFNANKELSEANRQSSTMKDALDEIDGIVAEIKSMGKKYVLLNKQSTECPLCDTAYTNEELLRRIETLGKLSGDNSALNSLSNEIIRLEGVLSQRKAESEKLAAIENIFLQLTGNQAYLSMTFIEFEDQLKRQIELTKQQNIDIAALKATKESLDNLGINPSQLVALKVLFEDAFPISFSRNGLGAYKKLYDAAPGILEGMQIAHNVNVQAELKQKEALDALRVELQIPDDQPDSERYLQFKETGLSAIEKIFTEISLTIKVDDGDSTSVLRQNLGRLVLSFNNYRSAREEVAKVSAANQIISEAGQQIEVLKPVVERIKTAVNLLSGILETDKQETILGEFLSHNEKDIEAIFLSLHTPKEFTGISFNYQTKTVLLQKRGTADPVPLNKISTGQRSALALSIFLALNKKVNTGPKILLFDDPVTYTDDLNILSFLDYLRNLVIKENRQIVFATANKKLAGLFEKKFGFLEEELEVIPLERQGI